VFDAELEYQKSVKPKLNIKEQTNKSN
jgi:hypothetical protein